MNDLGSWIQGATYPSMLIMLQDAAGNAFDLTGATISATIKLLPDGAVRAATGTFTLDDDPTTGQFTWALSEEDVADEGKHGVRFQADYSGGLIAKWEPAELVIKPDQAAAS